MVDELIVSLFRWWPASVLALLVAGFLLPRVRRASLRYGLLTALVLAAPMLMLLEGAETGCLVGSGGERCFGFGFGMIVALMYGVPAAAILIGLGALIARVVRR